MAKKTKSDEVVATHDEEAVAVLDQESTAEVDPSTLFVDKKEDYLATASEGVADEFLPVPISKIWLKSPGGVEYLIQAEDMGLLVIGNGKAVVLCGTETPVVPVVEELVSNEPAPAHPNRQYTHKPRG